MTPMTLGGFAFSRNPNTCTIPKKTRFTSLVHTYGGAVFFSWGTFLDGAEIEMKWELMTSAMFNILQGLLENDEEMVWNPQAGTSYNVQMQTLEGEWITTSLIDAGYRQNVTLKMVVMSEV